MDQVSKPTINFSEYGYDTISYNERYCQPLAQQFRKYDDIQLHSHLGTGKTTVICDLILEGNYTSIVCITPRVAFAHSIHASLKKVEDRFVLYNEGCPKGGPVQGTVRCLSNGIDTHTG